MHAKTPTYHGYRFPPEIISHAVWLYYRFCLSFRDVEDLLAERGIIVSHETIRQWSRKFGAEYARKLKRREGRLGDTWHLDELFVLQGSYLNPHEPLPWLRDNSSGYGDVSEGFTNSSEGPSKVHRNGPPVDHGH